MTPLITLLDEADYRRHFEQSYCRGAVVAHDGIRVFFKKSAFDHAFYESSKRDGVKDTFSLVRAQRLDWIAETLTNPAATRYQGYVRKTRSYDPTRCVGVVLEDFVVVLALGLKADGQLKGEFVTCYQADNSIGKIRQSPLWDKALCLAELEKRKGGR